MQLKHIWRYSPDVVEGYDYNDGVSSTNARLSIAGSA